MERLSRTRESRSCAFETLSGLPYYLLKTDRQKGGCDGKNHRGEKIRDPDLPVPDQIHAHAEDQNGAHRGP